MITPTGIKRALVLSIVSFSLLVIFSAFPLLHDHEIDGGLHRDCVACLLLYSAIALTAVFVFSVYAFAASTSRPRKAVCNPVLVAREKNKRGPPSPLV